MIFLKSVSVCVLCTCLCLSVVHVSKALAWTVAENGARRPLLLQGAGDVKSADLPDAIQSAMQVDALTRTVVWNGDRGTIRAAAGERLILKNGRKISLPRPVRLFESSVFFPEELLKFFPDIFSFVETASAGDEDVLNVRPSPQDFSLAEPSPDLRPPAPSNAVSRPTRAVRTVVIDPGHGGGDPGARGKSGAVEKDIVLSIGLATARVIQERDLSLKVILTRSRDEFVSLQDRARMANVNKGDLFVSIHANSVRRNSDAGGFEIYHLAVEGANDEARALAAFENAESLSSERDGAAPGLNPELGKILGDVMQLQYVNASLELSKHTADHMSVSLEGASKFRGSKGAFFYVLKDVLAPAILVEVGFVTNEWESSFLQKPWYQRKIAEGIAGGILKFKEAEDARMARSQAVDAPDADEK